MVVVVVVVAVGLTPACRNFCSPPFFSTLAIAIIDNIAAQ
jgi:hypothetical protein